MDLLEVLYYELADQPIGKTPFKTTEAAAEAENTIYELAITPLKDKDRQVWGELDRAYCISCAEAEKSGFRVGFKTAVALMLNGGVYNA